MPKNYSSSEAQYTQRLLLAMNLWPDCKAIKMPGGPRLETGTPDVVGCIAGHAFLLEIKIAGGDATAIQQHRLMQWSEAGAYVSVIETGTPPAAVWAEIIASIDS